MAPGREHPREKGKEKRKRLAEAERGFTGEREGRRSLMPVICGGILYLRERVFKGV